MADYPQFFLTSNTPGPDFEFPASQSQQAIKNGRTVKGCIDHLIAQISDLEMKLAEETARRAALSRAVHRTDVEARAKRHLDRYRKKQKKAQETGDHTAVAVLDQRIKALEALLDR